MAESEGIQVIFNQAPIQVPTAVMMVLIDANVGPWSTATARPRYQQTETWQTSFRKVLIKLECPGLVY